MIIRIKNMRLRSLVGINAWERKEKQSLIINAEIEFDGTVAAQTDSIDDTVDYRALSNSIAELVENSEFFLIETVANRILKLILEQPLVVRATVEVDKPFAIRFAESASVEVSGGKKKASAAAPAERSQYAGSSAKHSELKRPEQDDESDEQDFI